jgi:hypothetical protein
VARSVEESRRVIAVSHVRYHGSRNSTTTVAVVAVAVGLLGMMVGSNGADADVTTRVSVSSYRRRRLLR